MREGLSRKSKIAGHHAARRCIPPTGIAGARRPGSTAKPIPRRPANWMSTIAWAAETDSRPDSFTACWRANRRRTLSSWAGRTARFSPRFPAIRRWRRWTSAGVRPRRLGTNSTLKILARYLESSAAEPRFSLKRPRRYSRAFSMSSGRARRFPTVRVKFCKFANANSSVRWDHSGLEFRITDVLEGAPAAILESLANLDGQAFAPARLRGPTPSATGGISIARKCAAAFNW